MPKFETIGGCSSEYSQSTKFEVSRRLRSLVLCRLSPTFPPFPSFRPALSFFFFAVRTLPNRISILDGNWSAGRWNERASCFDKRVLNCTTLGSEGRRLHLLIHSRMGVAASVQGRRVPQPIAQRSDERDVCRLSKHHRSGRWRD